MQHFFAQDWQSQISAQSKVASVMAVRVCLDSVHSAMIVGFPGALSGVSMNIPNFEDRFRQIIFWPL
jgi:hypothetical protein